LTDAQAKKIQPRISTLEKRARQSEFQPSALQSSLSSGLRRAEADLARLASEFAAFRAAKVSAAAHSREGSAHRRAGNCWTARPAELLERWQLPIVVSGIPPEAMGAGVARQPRQF
jgi:hypothetical protein